jgi:hypothetical protein
LFDSNRLRSLITKKQRMIITGRSLERYERLYSG